MAINIQKPISRDLLKQVIHDFDEYALYEILKDQEIIDVPEDYIRDDGTSPDAILVDSTNILLISPFIPDITIGEYVIHIEEQSHIGDVRMEKYARRLGEDMSDEDIEDLWDVTPEQLEVFRSLIQDQKISQLTLWSSSKTNDAILDNAAIVKAYVDEKVAKLGTVKMELVTTLPADPKENILYILQDGTSNVIYIYDGTQWVNTGVDLSSIDFSVFYTKAEVDAKFDDYSKTNEVVLVSDLKADLKNPSAGTAASTKAVSDAIADVVSGQVSLEGYFKTENLAKDLSNPSDDTVLTTKALKEILDNMSSLAANDAYEPIE